MIEAGIHYVDEPLIDTPGKRSPGPYLFEVSISDTPLPAEMFGQSLGNPKYDWNFATAPQPGLNNAVVQYPRGKMLGGSSGINFMAWDRASVKEYDAWQEVPKRPCSMLRGRLADSNDSWEPEDGTGRRYYHI